MMKAAKENSLFTAIAVEEAATISGGDLVVNVSDSSKNSVSSNRTTSNLSIFEPKTLELVIRILNLPGNVSLRTSLGL